MSEKKEKKKVGKETEKDKEKEIEEKNKWIGRRKTKRRRKHTKTDFEDYKKGQYKLTFCDLRLQRLNRFKSNLPILQNSLRIHGVATARNNSGDTR